MEYDYVEEHSNTHQFSVKTLADQIPPKNHPASAMITSRLVQKYGDKMMVYNSWQNTLTTIGHTVIKVAHPRCFLSKVLLGVGCFLKKKFASRLLVDTLAAIGLSCSYPEIQLLEASCISRKHPTVLSTGLSQWVADNADFNVNTLDGRNSWHMTALIQCVTPSTSIEQEEPVYRQVQQRRSIDAAELGRIELVPYNSPPSVELNTVLNLDKLYLSSKPTLLAYFHRLTLGLRKMEV
ncbi:uncharacterized protein LOC142317660 [Lycorma delicatula]|uniref:uncharacterized protein LOC142317660 n=1 Tax=Lycorma delicatula TaxID=130591 RepID=UPI003F51AB31